METIHSGRSTKMIPLGTLNFLESDFIVFPSVRKDGVGRDVAEPLFKQVSLEVQIGLEDTNIVLLVGDSWSG
jgi:hypothetical protein